MKQRKSRAAVLFVTVTGLLAVGGAVAAIPAQATSPAKPGHSISATHVRPYISPGMHQGEVLAVFRAGRHATKATLTAVGSKLLASAPNKISAPDAPGQGEPYNVGQWGICNSANYCINATAGGSEDRLQAWQNNPQGASNNYWMALYVGTVRGTNCTNDCWPFPPGSGLNKDFNGEYVTNFEFYKGESDMTDRCINDLPGSNFQLATLGSCSGYRSDNKYSWMVWGDGGYRIKGIHITDASTSSPGGKTVYVAQIQLNENESYGDGDVIIWVPTNSNLGNVQIFHPTVVNG